MKLSQVVLDSARHLGLLGVLAPAVLADPGSAASGASNALAIRVGRAETVSAGTIEHAVILVADGKIVVVGEDLPIDRGIPVLDRPEWVVTPGLVDCWSRIGMDGRGPSNAFEPQARTSKELYAHQDVWAEILEAGVTTLGLYPDGSGIPGQAVAVRPHGKTAEEMIVDDPAYLRIVMESDPKPKKILRDGFKKADEYLEKVAKAREKWEEKQEKKKSKKKSSKKDDDKDKDEKSSSDKDDDDVFVAPEVDEKVQVFLDLREGKLPALIEVGSASTWMHTLDALGDEEITWSMRVPIPGENDFGSEGTDIWFVQDAIGHREKRIVLDTRLAVRAHTRREINIAREMDEAGAKVVLIPQSDSVAGHERWLRNAGELVAAGLDRQTALRAMTLEAAAVLGLEERVGSIEEGKDANLVFFDGDPFEPGTEVQAVMLEGDFVTGEVNL